MITKYVKGDITKTELKYIIHGVNCMNKMNAGVAKSIYEAFPEVKERYHGYASQYQGSSYNQKMLLGDVQSVKTKGKVIYNCFTQLDYGRDGKRYVNYKAIIDCFKALSETLEGEILAIPKIGAGLANGKWEFIEQLINDTVEDKLEIWVYEL